MADLSPPPFDISDQILASNADKYAAQEKVITLLKIGFGSVAVVCVALAGLTGYTVSTKKDHFYKVYVDEHGIEHAVKVTPESATYGETLEIAEKWIFDMMTITRDAEINKRMRGDVVARTTATPEEKDLFILAAYADLEKKKGYIAEVSPVRWENVGNSGAVFRALWTVTYRDMREIADREQTYTETYSALIQKTDVPPTVGDKNEPRNLSGILFDPVEPDLISTTRKAGYAK